MVQYGNMFSCVVSSAATRGCSGFQISHDRYLHACAARGVYLLEYVMGQGPYMVPVPYCMPYGTWYQGEIDMIVYFPLLVPGTCTCWYRIAVRVLNQPEVRN